MRVLDASACVDLLLGTSRAGAAAEAVRGQDLVAPSLLDVEVVSALARLERAGEVPASHADAALSALQLLRLDRLADHRLLDLAWPLRRQVRVSDAFYLAAARLVGAPLVTADARLARAGVTGVAIHLIA